MKKILFVGVILAAAILLTRWPRESRSSEKALPGFVAQDVRRIVISSPGHSTSLVLGKAGWEVVEAGNYPADAARVATLLREATEARPIQQMDVPEDQLGRLQLDASGANPATAATRVEFLDASGGCLASLLLGKNLMQPGKTGQPGIVLGRHVKTPTGPVSLTHETFAGVLAAPEAWLDAALPRTADLVAMESHSASGHWTMALQDNGAWMVADAPVPPPKVYSLLALWMAPAFDSLAPDQKPFVVDRTLTLRERSGRKVVFSLGATAKGKIPARVEVISPDPKDATDPSRWQNRIFLLPAFYAEDTPLSAKDLLPSEEESPPRGY